VPNKSRLRHWAPCDNLHPSERDVAGRPGAHHHDRGLAADRHVDRDERRHDGGHLQPPAHDGGVPAVDPPCARAIERRTGARQHGGRLRNRTPDGPIPQCHAAQVASRRRIPCARQLRVVLAWLGLRARRQVGRLGEQWPVPLVLLPLVGSGIVPTRSMSTGVRYFAEYQPFTPMINTLRGLPYGTSIGNDPAIATAWTTGICALGLFWSIKAFKSRASGAARLTLARSLRERVIDRRRTRQGTRGRPRRRARSARRRFRRRCRRGRRPCWPGSRQRAR